MSCTTFPPALTVSRPWSQRAWDSTRQLAGLIVHSATAAWQAAVQRRRARHIRAGLAHLSEHMLKDIGADGLLIERAVAQRRNEVLRTIELQRGGCF